MRMKNGNENEEWVEMRHAGSLGGVFRGILRVGFAYQSLVGCLESKGGPCAYLRVTGTLCVWLHF